MLARGHYEVKSKFIDDDKTTHKEWSWVSEQLDTESLAIIVLEHMCTLKNKRLTVLCLYKYSLSTSRRTGKEFRRKSPGEQADRQADRQTGRQIQSNIRHPEECKLTEGPAIFFYLIKLAKKKLLQQCNNTVESQ